MPVKTLLDGLFRRKKKLTLDEVRLEEKRLELRENTLVKKLEKMDKDKNHIFRRGAETKSRALRQIYARKFEEVGKQVQLEERELARLGKEIRVVGRIRMVLDRQEKVPSAAPLIERLTEDQLKDLMTLIDTADLKDAEFMERIDVLLGVTDREVEPVSETVGEEGMEVLKVWEEMDKGQFQFEEGLKEATRKVESRAKEKEAEEP